ncbi:MAG: cation-translocating P-type ATPase [Clostridiales bacterium]|nr:cation-translocating P-type ATPase [Clostridiales bacterium]
MWHTKTADDAIRALAADTARGLSETEAARRLAEHGANCLTEPKEPGILRRFLTQMADFMVVILLAAAGVSLLTSCLEGEADLTDPIIIIAIVALNAVLGVAQEFRAEKAIAALKAMNAPTAKARRNGSIRIVPAETLSPGDIVELAAGDCVPADVRLIETIGTRAEESALTGESVPVEKDATVVCPPGAPVGDRRNMAFSGSVITAGRAVGVVAATGMRTEFGRIAALVMDEDADDTPLKRRMAEMGKKLGIGAVAICAVIFVTGILRGIAPFTMFMTSVSLAVAAIPEGLPAIVTIMLALGVTKMAKNGAVARRLPAVETLGQITVICSDKTGTLTQNKMTVTEIADGLGGRFDMSERNAPAWAVRAANLSALCNDSAESGGRLTGDPTETALVAAAAKTGFHKTALDRESPRVAEIPFDSSRKMMTTVHKTPDGYMVVVKGAPEAVLARCVVAAADKAKILRANSSMAARALRVIAIARKTLAEKPERADQDSLESGLTFAGLIGMIDPPRPQAEDAVAKCRRAGIKTVMVTGDHALTAAATARSLGISRNGRVMTGAELSAIPDGELAGAIGDCRVFARVSPEHKIKLVKAFKSAGETVLMTGDGVNDAPALKSADVGAAMGIAGTDAAKGAAGVVLMDDDFATIVKAISYGRGVFENIRKASHFLLSSNIGELLTIFAAILLGWESPLLAIHLLWVNLVTDALPAAALGLDPAAPDIMERPASEFGGHFIPLSLWRRIGLEGVMIGALALIAFGAGKSLGSLALARTMAFATLSLSQLVHAFNMRSETRSAFSRLSGGNIYLAGAFLIGAIMQVSAITVPILASVFKTEPLSPAAWTIVAALSAAPLLVVELEKKLLALGKARKRIDTIGVR